MQRARQVEVDGQARRPTVGIPPGRSGEVENAGPTQRSCPSSSSFYSSFPHSFFVVMSQFRRGFMKNWFAIEVRPSALLPCKSPC